MTHTATTSTTSMGSQLPPTTLPSRRLPSVRTIVAAARIRTSALLLLTLRMLLAALNLILSRSSFLTVVPQMRVSSMAAPSPPLLDTRNMINKKMKKSASLQTNSSTWTTLMSILRMVTILLSLCLIPTHQDTPTMRMVFPISSMVVTSTITPRTRAKRRRKKTILMSMTLLTSSLMTT